MFKVKVNLKTKAKPKIQVEFILLSRLFIVIIKAYTHR